MGKSRMEDEMVDRGGEEARDRGTVGQTDRREWGMRQTDDREG